MNIAFIVAELAPLAREGELADVTGSLPPALVQEGVDVSIFLPFYGCIDRSRLHQFEENLFTAEIPMGGDGPQPLRVCRTMLPGSDIPIYLFHNAHYYERPGIYTDPTTGEEYADSAHRHIFFAKSCLEFSCRTHRPYDVVHCHDCHTAPVIALLRTGYGGVAALGNVGAMFTVHDIAYQGIYSPNVLEAMGLQPDLFYPLSPFEYYGQVNFMKLGIYFADIITTVSERYAQEIQSNSVYGYSLEGILHDRAEDLFGVLNGVDYRVWDPRHDSLIARQYDADSVTAGKRANKQVLLTAFGFEKIDLERPVLGMITRLVDKKGIDLVAPLIASLVEQNVYFVLMGAGLLKYQEMLEQAAKAFPNFLGVKIGFDNVLAHLIEAGSDILLMPSRHEPCGLNQMYSLRYGTVPVVRATGGLADTVVPYDSDLGEGDGFAFTEYSLESFAAQVKAALALFLDKTEWGKLIRSGMERDYSWQKSARRYHELYRLIESRRGKVHS